MAHPHDHDAPGDHVHDDHDPELSAVHHPGSDHEHDDHDHEHPGGWWATVRDYLPFGHGHSHAEAAVDSAMESSDRGIWALKISLVGLGTTALLQFLVVLLSGSVALLADTIHNFSDMLTAIPLWIAFSLARRPASRRFTYGYGRAEDVAGVIIVGMIFLSAVVAAGESILKLIHPSPVGHLAFVAVAALIGFAGNEGVAVFRIRVGREIGSAALIADGVHARTDGVTSLAVLLGVLGVALGFPLADPILGLVITVAILFIVRDTARAMWLRLMDAVDPSFVERVERVAGAVPGVVAVGNVRVRWIGHRLSAELHATVNEDLPTYASHAIIEDVRHALFHDLPKLTDVIVHADPCGHGAAESRHATTEHHAAAPRPATLSAPRPAAPEAPHAH